MKLSRERWLEVEPLLTTALEMDVASRTAWLDALDTSNPGVAPLLRKMLQTHERAERAGDMETVPRLAPAPPPSSAHSANARIGPFRLLRQVGRGGMGEVWLAEQADGRVERQVALKLPALHLQGGVWEERFRRERDILAKLAHPNIARLYDAGVSDSGQPYLAMEYVEGESLTDYVASHALPIGERLHLFRQVLAATGHAHRHLVVHRDLKPANILIDESGQVKLLDFGIAKLLDDEDAAANAQDLTRMGGRVMTLRYAAPEQVAGEAITTATDIYALGVILHELVTGLSPYRAAREGRPLTEAMLRNEETTVPSALAPSPVARQVRGDLDAILLKAMRKDAADRYASIEQFDDDLLRHLERRPVKARAGTWRYLAGRFALRYRLPLAMAAAVLVTMTAGLIMVEQQRRVAVAEKARAEKHFASVRKLANTFIFEVNAQIEALPGALKAREMLVRTSLEYLDTLSKEAGHDPVLMAELAGAYRDIGNIQGAIGNANTGDQSASLANYEKSKRLFVAVDALRPMDIQVLRGHWTLSYVLARSYAINGRPGWQEEIADTVKLSERIAALPEVTPNDRARVAMSLAEQANLTNFRIGSSPEVRAKVTRSIELLEALVRERPDDIEMRGFLVSNYQRGALIFYGSNRTKESTRQAIEYSRKSLAMAREVLVARPDSQKYRGFEMSNLTALSEMLAELGDYREADAYIIEALALGREQHARDPKNADVTSHLVSILGQASYAADRLGDQPRAIRNGREALAMAAKLPEGARNSTTVRNYIAEAQSSLATALVNAAEPPRLDREQRLAMLREARSLLADAVTFMKQLRADNLSNYADSTEKELLDTVRRCDEAIAKLAKS